MLLPCLALRGAVVEPAPQAQGREYAGRQGNGLVSDRGRIDASDAGPSIGITLTDRQCGLALVDACAPRARHVGAALPGRPRRPERSGKPRDDADVAAPGAAGRERGRGGAGLGACDLGPVRAQGGRVRQRVGAATATCGRRRLSSAFERGSSGAGGGPETTRPSPDATQGAYRVKT